MPADDMAAVVAELRRLIKLMPLPVRQTEFAIKNKEGDVVALCPDWEDREVFAAAVNALPGLLAERDALALEISRHLARQPRLQLLQDRADAAEARVAALLKVAEAARAWWLDPLADKGNGSLVIRDALAEAGMLSLGYAINEKRRAAGIEQKRNIGTEGA